MLLKAGLYRQQAKASGLLHGLDAGMNAQLCENVPDVGCYIPQATYLAWVDMNRALPDVEDLCDFFANEAGVLLEGGDQLFVGNAKGFVRLNLAMPRSILEEGLKRMSEAIKQHNK